MEHFTFSADQLNSNDANLLAKAREALKDAYAPYSNFRVGAACILDSGEIIKGSNMENASYPLCLCAERTALAAVHAMHQHKKVLSMAITAQSQAKKLQAPISPCGACRQVILEFEQKQQQEIKIILQGEEGPVVIFNSIKELLPMSFDGKVL